MIKKLIVLVLALAMILSLVACGKSGNDADDAGAGSAGGADAVDKTAEINVGLYALTNSLEPLSEDFVIANIIVYHVYDRLVEFVPSSIEWLPGIAKSWQQVDDQTWNFEINLDYKFSNGDQLTMEDVAFSILRLKDIPKVAEIGALIDSVTYDGTTLTIKGINADNTLMHKVLSRAVIVDKAYLESGGDEALYAKPIGTGPYAVTEFTPNATCSIEVWDGYPFEKPQIDKINFSVIVETNSRYVALETGQLQVSHYFTPFEMGMAEENPNLSTMYEPTMLIFSLLFNTKRPPFDNANVRRALAYAFDRDGFCSLLGGRLPARTSLFIGAEDFMRTSPNMPGYDLEMAKSLLEAEGYNDSNPLRFTVTCNTESDPGIEMYKAALSNIGVDMTISILEFSVFLGSAMMTGDFEMAFTVQPNIGNHPLTDIDRYDSNLYGVRNETLFFNERAQEIIDEFRFIPASDPRLKQLADELTDIVAQEVPMIPIYIIEANLAFDNRISGIVIDNSVISFRSATFSN